MRLALTALAVSFAVLAAPVGAQEPEVDQARAQADVAAAEVAASQSVLAELEQEVAVSSRRAAALEIRLSALQGVVQDQAVDQFVRGGTDPTGADLLLRGEDLDSAVRAGALARSVSTELAEVLDEYRRAADDLAGTTARLAELERRQAAAAAELRQRAAAAAAELERQVALAAERRAAAEAAADPGAGAVVSQVPAGGGTSAGAATSAFLCPVDGPRAFTNDWGQPRSGGRRHQGTDILSPKGTPVVASVAGTLETSQSSLGGVSYDLHGDDGNTYFGTHLHSLSGARGRVAAGTVIGYVGNSGNARGGPTHLHFEIRPAGGGAVNPHPTLAASC